MAKRNPSNPGAKVNTKGRTIGRKSTHKQKLGITRKFGSRTMRKSQSGFPKGVG